MALRVRMLMLGLAACAGGDTRQARDAEPVPEAPDAASPDAERPVDADAADGAVPEPDSRLPRLPVGYAAFRELGRLPVVRIGQRSYMTSTYDRSGGNEAADASHFLRQERADLHISLDTSGPGILAFVRTNHWHGSPWHYRVDGRELVVTESSTATPNQPVMGSVFMPEAAFPAGLTYTWSVTRGADLSWVSIPFERSLTLGYGRTHYGTGYYIYHRFAERAPNLPEPLVGFRESTRPPAEVLALLARAGEDIAPSTPQTRRSAGRVDVRAQQAVTLTTLDDGPRTLRKLLLSVPRGQELALGRARLRMRWDNADQPAVDAPVALFFGAGTLYNRAGREFLVKGLLSNIRFGERVELASYFPMPYQKGAQLELVAGDEDLGDVAFELSSEPSSDEPELLGHFHATYTDVPAPAPGHDLVLLDTTQAEGGGHAYCGVFVGMAWVFSERGDYGTLEGDPRFFFDDSQSPQVQGTGTEEWGGGGDYWGGETMTLPLAGHPVGAPYTGPLDAEDAIESAYRHLISDAMAFGKNARIQLEHGGHNDSREHYRAVSFWYAREGACLVQTDSLHVADAADARAHAYSSPDASEVQTLTSRYPLGVDTLDGVEIYPATTDTGRYTRGTSEFTLTIAADNLGVLLRRKLDYGFADQRAEVFVASAEPDAVFHAAGSWSLPGSYRCVYSNPPGELDAADARVQSGNRRFREDEFLLPPDLTRGLEQIRVRLRYVPAALPLLPGALPPESAWSEYRYSAYSYVLRP